MTVSVLQLARVSAVSSESQLGSNTVVSGKQNMKGEATLNSYAELYIKVPVDKHPCNSFDYEVLIK